MKPTQNIIYMYADVQSIYIYRYYTMLKAKCVWNLVVGERETAIFLYFTVYTL